MDTTNRINLLLVITFIFTLVSVNAIFSYGYTSLDDTNGILLVPVGEYRDYCIWLMNTDDTSQVQEFYISEGANLVNNLEILNQTFTVNANHKDSSRQLCLNLSLPSDHTKNDKHFIEISGYISDNTSGLSGFHSRELSKGIIISDTYTSSSETEEPTTNTGGSGSTTGSSGGSSSGGGGSGGGSSSVTTTTSNPNNGTVVEVNTTIEVKTPEQVIEEGGNLEDVNTVPDEEPKNKVLWVIILIVGIFISGYFGYKAYKNNGDIVVA